MTATSTEASAMRRAIALSALGLGTTSPNPPVGCVILDPAGRPVGEGYHQRKGEPHAEVNALAAGGANTRGGTAVVTLEPCNHHGRTPPCHQALIDAGITWVLISLIDPTSRGSGGAARLRQAGLDVEVGLLADEARVVLGPWLDALQAARPRVVWACVITDGGPRMVADDVFARAGLRCQVDAVIYGDGRVEEGLRNSHGEGAFSLPSSVPVTEPSTALSALYGWRRPTRAAALRTRARQPVHRSSVGRRSRDAPGNGKQFGGSLAWRGILHRTARRLQHPQSHEARIRCAARSVSTMVTAEPHCLTSRSVLTGHTASWTDTRPITDANAGSLERQDGGPR